VTCNVVYKRISNKFGTQTSENLFYLNMGNETFHSSIKEIPFINGVGEKERILYNL
jgi:hypothetical protein